MDENKNVNPEELEDEESDIVELVDEEGKSVNFRHVATIDYKDEWFVFFSPVEEIEGVTEDEVVIFKLGTDETGADVFLPIEDDKLLDEVYAEYIKVMEEEDGEGGCGCGCGCEDEEDDEEGCGCGCGCDDEEEESCSDEDCGCCDCGCGHDKDKK